LRCRPRSRNTDHMPRANQNHPQGRFLADERLLRVLRPRTRRVAIVPWPYAAVKRDTVVIVSSIGVGAKG